MESIHVFARTWSEVCSASVTALPVADLFLASDFIIAEMLIFSYFDLMGSGAMLTRHSNQDF